MEDAGSASVDSVSTVDDFFTDVSASTAGEVAVLVALRDEAFFPGDSALNACLASGSASLVEGWVLANASPEIVLPGVAFTDVASDDAEAFGVFEVALVCAAGAVLSLADVLPDENLFGIAFFGGSVSGVGLGGADVADSEPDAFSGAASALAADVAVAWAGPLPGVDAFVFVRFFESVLTGAVLAGVILTGVEEVVGLGADLASAVSAPFCWADALPEAGVSAIAALPDAALSDVETAVDVAFDPDLDSATAFEEASV